MSGYPYGGNPPQYPPPQNQIYPQIYNPANAPPPGQPTAPSYPIPGQNPQYPFQPGFAYPYPGQPTPAGQPAPPAAMSYPGGPAPAYLPSYPTVTPQAPFAPPVEWIPSTPVTAQALADKAVVAGYEGYDGSPLWVIRARFKGDLIPGKLAVKHRVAYVPYDGKENAVQEIEVCCARPERVRWVESRDGMIPPNAVIGGNTVSGETLYIGRAKEQGSLTPGKIHPSHRVIYISFGGSEVAHKVYEVLCTV